VEILVHARSEDEARSASAPIDAAFDEIRRVEALVDEDAPTSAVARINAAAGGDPVVVEPEVFAILAELQRVAKLTRGAFDLTAAAYGDAWRFEPDAAPTADPTDKTIERAPVPSKGALEEAKTHVGYEALVLDPATRTARLRSEGARIGIKALARGYALERAARVLDERGLKDFIVSAGGDLVVRGRKGDRPWMVGIQDPRAPGHFAAISADAGAVMTSGDYEEFFFDGGVRYHDLIDPRTGMPATRCRSVTVVAPDALAAEALSRAVFVLGPKDGLALVERFKEMGAVIVTADNRVAVSRSLKGRLQHRPPTDGL
jgi:thiamine biosynthesis lipoprotein